jgi:hypothetical protein
MQGERAEATGRRRAACWFIAGVILVLHWASPQFGQPSDQIVRQGDATPGFWTPERVSQPASLPRSLPRSDTLETAHSESDRSGLASGDGSDAPILRPAPETLAAGLRAAPVVPCPRQYPELLRPFNARAPPDCLT